jgi:hypothetical protein
MAIKGAVQTSKFDGKEKKSYDELKQERDLKDMNTFFKKYPDLKEVKI